MNPKRGMRSFIMVLLISCAISFIKPVTVLSQVESPVASAVKHIVLWMGGNSEYANAPHTSSLNVGTGQNDDFTVECFFYVPSEDINSYNHLIEQFGSYTLDINFHNSTWDYILFMVNIGSMSTSDLIYQSNITVGWHHLAVIFDNEYTPSLDRRTIYLDGMLVAEAENTEWTPGLFSSTSSFVIGSNSSSTFNGYLEEMRISSTIRYDGPIYAIPTDPFTKDAETRALWHFDETPGSTVFNDSSDYGNHLAGYNGATTVIFYENPIYIPLIRKP